MIKIDLKKIIMNNDKMIYIPIKIINKRYKIRLSIYNCYFLIRILNNYFDIYKKKL